ncbi:hypothetical protein [Coprothermobacter platensis]|uniref:hypothetical protein n=1 Tax=Coprothermobacter platensis TaxID=108819 RepID=UPI000365A0D3|nr:hypothetical protein [Coprothermobacter platensis]
MGIPDEYMGKYLDDTIYGMAGEGTVQPASSDVGDVSYVTPLAQFTTCCQALGSPGHSWQNVAAGGSSIAHKGLELAAKTLALSGSELLRNPEFIKDAREEFQKRTGGQPYKCALPPDVKPPLGELPEQ